MIKVSEHITPVIDQETYDRRRFAVLSTMYGEQIKKCGFCGNPCIRGYVCTCGYDKSYADEKDENGKLIPIWIKAY